MQQATILCYGEIDLDIYLAVSELPSTTRSALVTHEFDNIGGAAANTAIWLAKWGLPTRLVGTELGDDTYGGRVREQFSAYPSLDTQYVVYHDDQQTPRCQCLVTPDGERTFILHWLDEIIFTPLTVDMLQGIKWLSLDLSGQLDPRLHAAKLAKAQNVSVLVNDIYTEDHALLPYVDVIVISAAIARIKRPDLSPFELAESLRKRGHCNVIITDRSQPITALLQSGDSIHWQPPTITVVDSTGAGDIFKAGLLYGLVNDMPLSDALKWAVAAGSAKVSVAGTTLNPSPLTIVEDLVAKVR